MGYFAPECSSGSFLEVLSMFPATNTYDDNTVQLDINSDTRTRGHSKKLDADMMFEFIHLVLR